MVKIVAEMSASHHGSLARALAIIDAAKWAGADAVKIQTFTPDNMVADREFIIPHGPWKGLRAWDLYKTAMTPRSWHVQMFKYAKEKGIELFSSPFHPEDIRFLEAVGCPRYKIASFEAHDLQLIRCAALTGKPVIVSTGMLTEQEIGEAIHEVWDAGGRHLTLLKCTSAYPATAADANLLAMRELPWGRVKSDMVQEYGVSDHTPGATIPVVAAILGAGMIEKHITLDDARGPDAHYAMKPEAFKAMVDAVRDAEASLGQAVFGPSSSEVDSLLFRRSLYVIRDIPCGEPVTPENVESRRPNHGLPPKRLPDVIGRRAAKDLPAGTPLTWEVLN